MDKDLKGYPAMAALVVAIVICLFLTGCATTAMEAHREGMQSITEGDYFIPAKPVDRPCIGCAWSKQFGPIEDPASSDIRIKVEKSFNTVQQKMAYAIGASLGGQSTGGGTLDAGNLSVTVTGQGEFIKGEAGIEAAKATKSRLEDVQIITPISLADIPFELNIPYVTEALRLGNFAVRAETSGKASAGVGVSAAQSAVKAGRESEAGTAGDGLVVAYKLQAIDPKTYTKADSGSIVLKLDKTIDLQNAGIIARSYVSTIEPGSKQSMPRNLLWACDKANAKARDMVAAWIIDLRPVDPKRKSLQIAFPALPVIEDCQTFSGVIHSRIDPLTDKIIRQKIRVTIVEEALSDALKPTKWEARMSLVDESFNIKLIKQGDLSK